MPTYLSLMNWTKEGIEKIKESPARLEALRNSNVLEPLGGKIKGFYLLMGKYDLAALIEAPDDATIARINLWLASKGSLRTETHRAFDEEEYKKIIASIP